MPMERRTARMVVGGNEDSTKQAEMAAPRKPAIPYLDFPSIVRDERDTHLALFTLALKG